MRTGMRPCVACGALLVCVQMLCGQPPVINATGSIEPAPGRSLTIQALDLDSGAVLGTGSIRADGSFEFPVNGAAKRRVQVVIKDGDKSLYNDSQTLGTGWGIELAGVPPAPHTDYTLLLAGLWSILFSIIAGFVELQFRSKAELASCLGKSPLLYIVMICFFNTLASATAAGLLKDKVPGGVFLAPMFYALFGVFAFETVLSNTNITIFDKGVLAFQEWASKAREPAVASIQRRQSQKDQDRILNLAKRLAQRSESDIHTLVLTTLEKAPGEELIKESLAYQTQYGIEPKFYLALVLARSDSGVVESALKSGG